MRPVARPLLLALTVALLSPALSAVAADDGPLSLDDLRDMRRQRIPIKKVAEAMEERGLSFDVDDDAAKKLRGIGFSAKQVAEFKDKYGPVGGDAKAAGDKPAAKPDGHGKKLDNKGDKGAAKAKGKPRVMDAQTDADYKAMEERIDKIAKTSGVPVKPHKTKHTTIIANPRIAGMFVPDVTRLEGMVGARFPEPIASGVDMRANNIALLETRYEYESWIKALFKVHQDEGATFQGQDPLGSALRSRAIFVNGIFSVCLEGMQTEEARRAVAFGVGYQYFRQLTNDKSPEALQTGFGNITEAMMMREPGTTVLSGYTDRKLDAAPIRWSDLVRQQFMQNQAGSVQEVLRYSTQNMTLPKYAEAWSFTNLLAGDPRNFAELVTKLGEGTAAADAIQGVYGVNEQQAMQHWKRAVMGGR
jgi:hypothetical protein